MGVGVVSGEWLFEGVWLFKSGVFEGVDFDF